MWNRIISTHWLEIKTTPLCLLLSCRNHVGPCVKYSSPVHHRLHYAARGAFFSTNDALRSHHRNLKAFCIPFYFDASRDNIFWSNSLVKATFVTSSRCFSNKQGPEKIMQPDNINDEKIPPKERSSLPQISWKLAVATSLTCCAIAGYVLFIMDQSKKNSIAKVKSTTVGKPKLGGPWTLVNQRGNLVSHSDFRGKYQLLYFGFSFCPDICPLELEKQSQVVEELDKIFGPVVQPIFVTVDPGRDTVAQVEAYCREFHPRLIGLTGTPEQIKKITRSFRVYYNEGIRTDDDDYLVDHSIIQYLIGTSGKFKDFFGKNMTATEMVDKISAIIRSDQELRKKKGDAAVDVD
ncbi:SCO1/SenC protein [Cardiosporidium cionae]|uniref:SCO1/SenC protein n=1 Tax=Cardiosporidium cionae TaxID=476202 RepID=A0ABQ7J7G2_9APIC|nr:SCO1/SenC protein [Cardiosporidium cionae]|eukprot:KAF8819928.1 SCO1/SenC protein [Cardiosporidium cionae]